MSIGQGDDGRALVHCFAGCGFGAILKALCLRGEYLVTPPPVSPEAYAQAFVRHPGFEPVSSGGSHPTSRGMRLVAQHVYEDRWWLLRYRHPVTGAKELSWESLNSKGERVPGLLGTPTRELPLYRESDIKKGMALHEPILLVESESSVDALKGWYATTWAGGAASPPIGHLRAVLGGYEHLVVIPDADNPGLDCLERLFDAGLVPNLLHGEPGEDARDLYQRVGPEGFRRLVEFALTNHNEEIRSNAIPGTSSMEDAEGRIMESPSRRSQDMICSYATNAPSAS